MSGYGSPDDEAIHAGILAENGVNAVRARAYTGTSAIQCMSCGDPIPEARRTALPGVRTCLPCRAEQEQSRKGA